ncbi:S9 family peptidase [Paenibacillus sp. SC116]|uniref:S9 family peptidase n=1 Tax=Paenibacillus sp. SC116 TaxID=2968986 RepID=UPI00215ABBE4|nr:S9 family peptidase [Paenibacillus sp. SC116]MCR8845365.1 S9 family peptidase [Paenibacillus sp. SC116]
MGKRNITSEDLFKFKWVSNPSVCPVSNRIAYVSKKVNEDRSGYDTSIRVVTSNGEQDRAWTQGSGDSSPAWSQNGTSFAFLRKDGEHNQVWMMDVSGGEAYAVTKAETGVSSFAFSPDGQYILYLSKVEAAAALTEASKEDEEKIRKAGKQAHVVDRLMYKSDGSGLWNGKRTHLFVHDCTTDESKVLTSGEFDVTSFAWAPDSTTIAYTAKKLQDETVDPDLTRTNDLFIVERTNGESRRITDSRLTIGKPTFAPDGRTIAFHASDYSHGFASLQRLYTLSYPEGNLTCHSQHLDWQLGNNAITDMKAGEFEGPLFSKDGQTIYTLATIEGSVHIIKFGLDGTHELLTEGPQEIIQFELTEDETSIVMVKADMMQPGELFSFNLETKTEVQLTHHNDAFLGELELSKPEIFWFETSDGWKVQGWMVPPVGMEKGCKYPTILEIHGGPHGMYASSFMHEFQLLAAQGYAVIYTNPRGGHGYGQKFVNACRGDYGGRDYQDLMEAVDYAIANFDYIDETRMGVTGGSYGGFMTNWIVGHTDRFIAAVTQRSISNWISFYGVSDIGYYFTEDQIDGNAWADMEKLWKHSPIAYVEKMNTPLLILHGEQDLRCPIEQAEQLFIALKRQGKATQFVRFPDANHNLSRSGHPELRIERLDRIVGWMNRFIPSGAM